LQQLHHTLVAYAVARCAERYGLRARKLEAQLAALLAEDIDIHGGAETLQEVHGDDIANRHHLYAYALATAHVRVDRLYVLLGIAHVGTSRIAEVEGVGSHTRHALGHGTLLLVGGELVERVGEVLDDAGAAASRVEFLLPGYEFAVLGTQLPQLLAVVLLPVGQIDGADAVAEGVGQSYMLAPITGEEAGDGLVGQGAYVEDGSLHEHGYQYGRRGIVLLAHPHEGVQLKGMLVAIVERGRRPLLVYSWELKSRAVYTEHLFGVEREVAVSHGVGRLSVQHLLAHEAHIGDMEVAQLVHSAQVVVHQCLDEGHDAASVTHAVMEGHEDALVVEGDVEHILLRACSTQGAQMSAALYGRLHLVAHEVDRLAFYLETAIEIGEALECLAAGILQGEVRHFVAHTEFEDLTLGTLLAIEERLARANLKLEITGKHRLGIYIIGFCLKRLPDGELEELGHEVVGLDGQAHEGVVPVGEVIAPTGLLIVEAIVLSDAAMKVGIYTYRKVAG